MRWVFKVAAIGSAMWCTSAFAQPLRDCNPNIRCRAMYSFGQSSMEALNMGCGRDAIAVEGIVAGFQSQTGKCTRVIVRAAAHKDLPERLLIDTSSCVVWNGRIGDTLRGFVRRDPLDQNRFDAVPYCIR